MQGNKNSSSKQKSPFSKRKLAGIIILLILVVGGAGLFIKHQQLHNRQVSTHIPSTNPAPKKVARSPDKATNATAGNVTTIPSDKSLQPPTTTGAAPITPSGTFVSNHRPSLSGDQLSTQEQSVCNTTPGASCYIEFTKDNITKTLTAQTADSNGSVYWTWDINQAGLTQGSWDITAVATLNGQTATAKDSLQLEVQP